MSGLRLPEAPMCPEWAETPWSPMCPACSYLREDSWRWGFFRDIQHLWAWPGMDHSTCTPPLLASKDIFRRHLKKTDIHLPCLAASLICKVPLYSRFISGTDKLMITPLGVLQQHITGKHVWCYSSSRQAWFSSWTSGGTGQRQQNTVTTPCFGQRFDSNSCWIKHESIQLQLKHHTHGLIHYYLPWLQLHQGKQRDWTRSYIDPLVLSMSHVRHKPTISCNGPFNTRLEMITVQGSYSWLDAQEGSYEDKSYCNYGESGT